MRIDNVVRVQNANFGRNVAFKRRLKETEKKDYTETINKAMDYLGVQNRALIIHGPSFPAKIEEKTDIGVGSPYNSEEFIDFLKLHGFNGVQLGPTGKLNRGDTSPYSSSVFAKNPLFIDFNKLRQKEYASILSKQDIKNNIDKIENTKDNYARADYNKAEATVDNIIDIAFDNFIDKLKNDNENALKLQDEFNKFKEENADWLDYYAVLDSIAKKYGTDYYPYWNKEDSTLIQRYKHNDYSAIQKFNEIQQENLYDIEKYKFTQFIIDKQTKEDDKARGNFIYISDLLVGVSSYDEMIFQDAFLDGWKIGAKEGGVLNSPQLWNIPVVDPNKLFNNDGTLGESGKFVQMKINKAIQDSSNLRIDHAFGLVDPFIYRPDSIHSITKYDNGRPVEVPDANRLKGGNLSELNLDWHGSFQKIVPNIVIPALTKAGINPREAVWEDLGNDSTGLYNKICKDGLGLPGIDVLLWSRGEMANKNNWAYIGCHDNAPIRQGIESKEAMRNNPNAWNTEYLAGYLNPGTHNKYKRHEYRNKIEHNPKEMFKAKFTELFRSTKNIQISFMDFFGINKRFNTPGTTNDENWTLRLAPDWEDKYYKSLENDDWAVNIPEILSKAVEAKASMEIAKNENTMSHYQKMNIMNDAKSLMQPLNKYSEILERKRRKLIIQLG